MKFCIHSVDYVPCKFFVENVSADALASQIESLRIVRVYEYDGTEAGTRALVELAKGDMDIGSGWDMLEPVLEHICTMWGSTLVGTTRSVCKRAGMP